MNFIELWGIFSLGLFGLCGVVWAFVRFMRWLDKRLSWKVYTPILVLAYTAFLAAVLS